MFKEVDQTYDQLRVGDIVSLALPKTLTVYLYKYTNYHTQHETPSLKDIKDIMSLSGFTKQC